MQQSTAHDSHFASESWQGSWQLCICYNARLQWWMVYQKSSSPRIHSRIIGSTHATKSAKSSHLKKNDSPFGWSNLSSAEAPAAAACVWARSAEEPSLNATAVSSQHFLLPTHTHTHTSMNQHRHVRETDLKKIIKQIKTPHEECVRTQPGDTRSPHRRGDCLPARLPVGGEMNLFAWPSSSPLCSTEHKRRARANYLFIWVILTQREPSSSTPQSRLHMTGSGTVYLSAPAMLPAQTPGGQR